MSFGVQGTGSVSGSGDMFSIAKDTKTELFREIFQLADALRTKDPNKKIKLFDGKEFAASEVNNVGVMTAVTMSLQWLQTISDFVDNTLVFTKNVENKVEGLIS